MKDSFILLRTGLIALAICLAVPTATIAETVKQKEQRESFQKYLEAKLYEVNQRLDRLAGKAGDVKEEAKKEFSLVMEEMANKRQLAGKKLFEMHAADARDWDRLKVETSFAIDDLNRIHDRMLSLLKR